MGDATRNGALARRRALVVEDDYFIADDLARALRKFDAEVVGPVPTCNEALRLLAAERIDLAILDINLRDAAVFPVADVLSARGTPFVFATGYGETSVPDRFRDVPRWEKPFNPDALALALA